MILRVGDKFLAHLVDLSKQNLGSAWQSLKFVIFFERALRDSIWEDLVHFHGLDETTSEITLFVSGNHLASVSNQVCID